MDPADLARHLVGGLRRGEAQALDAAFALWQPRLCRFLVRAGARRDEAEDLVQDAFVQLARAAMHLRPDTDLGAWLFTVARNGLRAAIRRRSVRERGAHFLDDALPPPDPERLASARQGATRLAEAFERLSLDEREVLLVAAEGEITSARAAEVLGVTPAAFRKRLERARARLTAILDEDAGESAAMHGHGAKR